MRQSRLIVIAALAGSLLATSSLQAAPMVGSVVPASNATSNVVQVRSHGHSHHGGGGGAGVAAGIIGGAILGGIIASQQPYYYGPGPYYGPPPGYYGAPGYGGPDWYAYCSSRYRSFDPASGTYLGYDGYRHPCR